MYEDVDLPEGVTLAAFKSHPVREMISDAAQHGERGLPSASELKALDLNPAIARKVDFACRTVAEIHGEGSQADAWSAGNKAAARLIGELPEEQRDPGYRQPPEPEETHPDKLAAQVPRI